MKVEHKSEYKNRFRQLASFLIVLTLLAVGLSFYLAYQIITTPEPKYYATNAEGHNEPLVPLDEPVVTDDYLLQWAALAVRATFNLDFYNYEKQLKDASQYYTKSGWLSAQSALGDANVINSLKNNKLIMEAVAAGPAIKINSYVSHGRYTWEVQMKLLVNYTSANEKKKKYFIVSAEIVRIPVLDTNTSIQINKLQVS